MPFFSYTFDVPPVSKKSKIVVGRGFRFPTYNVLRSEERRVGKEC